MQAAVVKLAAQLKEMGACGRTKSVADVELQPWQEEAAGTRWHTLTHTLHACTHILFLLQLLL